MIQKDKKKLSPSSESSGNKILHELELFPTSIYILDERGIIIEVNNPALELTGGKRKKIILHSVSCPSAKKILCHPGVNSK